MVAPEPAPTIAEPAPHGPAPVRSAPYKRMQEGKPYNSDEINAMNAEVGAEVKASSFVAALYDEELR